MALPDNIKVVYKLPVIDNASQGLVFGSPAYDETESKPTEVDGIKLSDIFASILGDTQLMQIIANRADSIEGQQQIETAIQSRKLENERELQEITKDTQNIALLEKTKKEFNDNLKDDKILSGQYPTLPDNNAVLPKLDKIEFSERIKTLITYYNILKAAIRSGGLFAIGKFMEDDKQNDAHLPNIQDSDFTDKDPVNGLKAMLFFVAKTFMRIPIVLLVCSTRDLQSLPTEYYVHNESVDQLRQRLISDCYPFETYLQSDAASSQNKTEAKLSQSLTKKASRDDKGKSSTSDEHELTGGLMAEPKNQNETHNHIYQHGGNLSGKLLDAIDNSMFSKMIYTSYSNDKHQISIDMLCYLLLYINTGTSLNYENLLVLISERLCYIINYWCGTPSTQLDTVNVNNTAQSASSKLALLHNATVQRTIDGIVKLQSYATVLQKIHNSNDNLITFVKIRKGRVSVGTVDVKTIQNDGQTMYIRYNGVDPTDPGKLTDTDNIIKFQYSDDVKPFYKDCDKVVAVNGKETTIFKPFNEACDDATGTPVYHAKINQNELITNLSYNHTFYLGPFTQVFTEIDSNESMENSPIFQQKIYNQLTAAEPKPVCIIGYGASGSGKTSVLIKLVAPDGTTQEGILILLSRRLASVGRYSNCDVQILEFGKNVKGEDIRNERAFVGKYKYDTDTNGVQNWVIVPSWIDNLAEQGQSAPAATGEASGLNPNAKFILNGRKICSFGNMFDDILYFMNFERNVAKTPNNIESSRTHVIIVLKYSKGVDGDNPKTLFICDLAGVENAFDCRNITDKDDEKFRTYPNKPPDEKLCDPNDNTKVPAQPPKNAFGEVRRIQEDVIPFDPNNYLTKEAFETLPLAGKQHFERFNPQVNLLLDAIGTKHLTFRTPVFRSVVSDVVSRLKTPYFLMNYQFPLGNYYGAIKDSIPGNITTTKEKIQYIMTLITDLDAIQIEGEQTQSLKLVSPAKAITYSATKMTASDLPNRPDSYGRYSVGGIFLYRDGENVKKITRYEKTRVLTDDAVFVLNNLGNLGKKNNNSIITLDVLFGIPKKDRTGKITGYSQNPKYSQIFDTLNKVGGIKKFERGSAHDELEKILKFYFSIDGEDDFSKPIEGSVVYKFSQTDQTEIEFKFNINNGIIQSSQILDGTSFTATPIELTTELSVPINLNGANWNNGIYFNDAWYSNETDFVNAVSGRNNGKIPYTANVDATSLRALLKLKGADKFIKEHKLVIDNIARVITDATVFDKIDLVAYLKYNFLNQFNQPDGYDVSQLQVLLEQIQTCNMSKPNDPKNDYRDPELDSNPEFKEITKGGGNNANQTSCESRTAEGVYINASLKDMRMDIARHVLRNKSQSTPSFFAKCLPIQCNPEFKSCLGVNQYPIPKRSQSTSTPKDGDLISAVKKYCPAGTADKLVFCVFCVLNLSEPPLVKDPPPVPYIDITKLQQYYEILENIDIEKFRKVEEILTSIQQEISGNILRADGPFLNMNDEPLVELSTRMLTKITGILNTIRAGNQRVSIGDLKDVLRHFIDSISNINAATPIGTLLFTDAVSKSFANVNTCNVKNILDYTKTFKGGKQTHKKRTQKTRK